MPASFSPSHSASAQSVADFYKGKTIQIIVGFGVGGGYDLYARALGRYLGKYVPGNPNVVVQNMEGASSIRAANYVYGGSPQDGTVIAAVNQNAAMYQVLGGAGAKFEAAKLQWLGSMSNSNGTVYTWHSSGIKTLDDAKRTEVPVGAVGVQSDSVIYPEPDQRTPWNEIQADHRLCRHDANPSRHGARRGDGPRRQHLGEPARPAIASWIEEHKINILVQIGFEKETELADVPLLLDLVKGDEDKGVIRVVSLPTAIGFGHWLSPEVPKDRIAALRMAYVAALKDPDFIKEAQKTRMHIRVQTGAEVAALVEKVITTPKPVLERTARILKWK